MTRPRTDSPTKSTVRARARRALAAAHLADVEAENARLLAEVARRQAALNRLIALFPAAQEVADG